MKYIDIHCHLDFPDYGPDFHDVLTRMKEQEIGAITIGTDLDSSKRAVGIAEVNENIWACIGVHPADHPEKKRGEFNEAEFEELVENPKVVAIGECGLDYFRMIGEEENEKEKQKKIFERQIQFALQYDKPLMLHCRDAYEDVLEILAEYKRESGDKLRGNCHFFAGSVEQAREFGELGFSCSFTGVITFSRDYDEVIKFLTADSIMSETDAPFVTPIPHRGKRNEPSFVIEVIRKMAEIRGENVEELSQKIVNNAKRTFGLE